MLAMMLTRVSVGRGDLVRYAGARRPMQSVRPFIGKLGRIEQVYNATIYPEQLEPCLDANPYWVDVRFRNGEMSTLNLQHFLLEEVRQNVARILD